MEIRDYIEHLRRKPEHVRRLIALGASGAVTAVIAIGYIVALGSSGALALGNSAPQELPPIPNVGGEGGIISELMGAASAFRDISSGGGIITVDGKTTSTLPSTEEDERTVITF